MTYRLWKDEVTQVAPDKSCWTFTSFKIEDDKAYLGRSRSGEPTVWIDFPKELTYELKETVHKNFRNGESYTLDSGKTRGGLEESYYVRHFNVFVEDSSGNCAVLSYKKSEEV